MYPSTKFALSVTREVRSAECVTATCSVPRAQHTTCSVQRAACTAYNVQRAQHTRCNVHSIQIAACTEYNMQRAACTAYTVQRAHHTTCSVQRAQHTKCSMQHEQHTKCRVQRAQHTKCSVRRAARIMQHAASHAIACLRISLLHWSQVSGLEFPSSGSVRTGCAGLRKASRPALMHPGAAASAQRCADVHCGVPPC